MNNKVEDRTKWWVSFMSSRLWAYNQKNTIVINPDAPRDIEWKLYRNPDDANAYVVAQNTDFFNMYQLVYWPWSYTQPHTAIEFTRVFWTQLSSFIQQVDADLDFDWNNFINSIIGWLQIQTLNVWAWKVLAMLSWWIAWWTIEWAFSCVWWVWLNSNENIDASNADFIFSSYYEWIDCDLSSWWQFSYWYVDTCILWDWNYDNMDIANCTANPWMTNIWIYNSNVDWSFLETIPAWCSVQLINCRINWNFTNIADLVIANCQWQWNTITNDWWSLITAWLNSIQINDLSWWRTVNRWQTIDNLNFTVLTKTESQKLFEEIDTLISALSWWWFYIYQWATQSWNLFGNFNDLMNAAQPQFWVKTIYAWNGWSPIFVWSNWLTYDMKNFVIKNYAALDTSDQKATNISISTNVWQPHLMSLPRLIDNVQMTYLNSYWTSNYFRDFWNDSDSYPFIEMRNNAKISTGWTQSAFMVWQALKCNMVINMYDQSRIDAVNPTFILNDAQSTIDIHLYDDAKLLWTVVSNIFENVPWLSTKKNVRLHIHSPNVYVDPTFLNNSTVIFYWYSPYRNNPEIKSKAAATWTITDATWNNVLKQATFESTAHWLSVWDRVEISWITMSLWNLNNTFVEIVDVPSVDEFTAQYWSQRPDPWTYTSWWSRDLRTVVILWETNKDVWFMQQWQGISYNINIYNAANNNNKFVWLYFKDTTNWNIIELFSRLFNSADWNDTDVSFRWSAQTKTWISTDTTCEISIYDWTSTHEIQKWSYWANATQAVLAIVMDWIDADDITLNNLFTNPV